MVKICQMGSLKLNFEIIPKKRIFWFLPKKNLQVMDDVETFFLPIFKPLALRVSGMGSYTSKCEISQNHCTLFHIGLFCTTLTTLNLIYLYLIFLLSILKLEIMCGLPRDNIPFWWITKPYKPTFEWGDLRDFCN